MTWKVMLWGCGSHFHVAYRSVCDWDQEISILSEAWPQFWRSRTLFTSQEAWPRSETLLWAVAKWLPLVVLTTENNYLDTFTPDTHLSVDFFTCGMHAQSSITCLLKKLIEVGPVDSLPECRQWRWACFGWKQTCFIPVVVWLILVD